MHMIFVNFCTSHAVFNNKNAYTCDLPVVHVHVVDREVCSPVALTGRHTSSWPAGPGTEPSAGAAVSQQTGSFVSPLDQLESSPSRTDG